MSETFTFRVSMLIDKDFTVEGEDAEGAEERIDTILRYECPPLDEWDVSGKPVIQRRHVT